MQYTHSCIKCTASYEDTDPDAYYCAPCLEEKKRVAAEVDAKIAARPRKPVVSNIQAYDAAPKLRGFINAKDLL